MPRSIIVATSMKFLNEVQDAKVVLEGYGFEVTIPHVSSLDTNYDQLTIEERIQANHELIVNYQQKIHNSDVLLIWNQPKNSISGYIGPNTFLEMVTAFVYNKPLYILNPISPEQKGFEEMMALKPICIDNNLQKIPQS